MTARKKSPMTVETAVNTKSITVNLVNSCPNMVSQHRLRRVSFSVSSKRSRSSSVILSSGSSMIHLGRGSPFELYVVMSASNSVEVEISTGVEKLVPSISLVLGFVVVDLKGLLDLRVHDRAVVVSSVEPSVIPDGGMEDEVTEEK